MTETSERLNFARCRRSGRLQPSGELGARADAELRVDVREMAGHGPLAEEQRGRDLPVRPAFHDESATRRSAAVSPSSRGGRRSVPSSRACPVRPAGGSDLLEPRDRRLDRHAGGALLAVAPPDDAEREQRSRPPERVSDAPRAGQPPARAGRRPIDVAARGGDEPSAARHVREDPFAPERVRRPSPRCRAASVASSISPELEQQPRHGRRSTSGCSARATRAWPRCCSASGQPLRGRGTIAAPERDQPEDRQVLGGWSPNCSSASSSARSECCACELELAAVDGDEGDREVVLRHLEAVLDRDVVGARSVRGRELQRPAQSSTQARPQSARALRGSSRSRHSWCSRSSSTRRRPRRAAQRVDDRQRRLLDEPIAADGAREVGRDAQRLGALRLRRNQPRTACTARARAASASSSSSSASSSAVRACSSAADCLKRVAHASRQWIDRLERRPRRRLGVPPRAARRRVRALELGEEDERLGAPRADLRLGEQALAIVRARVHSPAAWCARAAASARRCRSSVRRPASAAAPARRARPRPPTRRARRPGWPRRRAAQRRRRPASPSRARRGAHAGADRRRPPRSAHGRCAVLAEVPVENRRRAADA